MRTAGTIATIVAAAGLALSTTAAAQSLELEYSVVPEGSLYRYHFETFPDAGWAPGMGWRWYIWGDCMSCPTPLLDFIGDPSFLPVGPWTAYSTSGGFHNGPTFSSVLDYWIPASGSERLVWEGTSTVDLGPGALLFSTLAGTVGGAVPADFKVAQRVIAGPAITKFGTAAPPPDICGQPVTAFDPDPRPLMLDEVIVPSPICGEIQFSIPLSHRRIGSGWATWSHGYTGDVYFTNVLAAVDVTVPDRTSHFYLYAEPDPFLDIEFELRCSGGTGLATVTETIHGMSGAKGYGFCDDLGIDKIEVRTTDGTTDFAIGEFGIYTATGATGACYADCDGNGTLDFFDFLCFQNAFATGACYADCDGNGVLDFFDFLCFQNEFATGCQPSLELIQLGMDNPPRSICGKSMTPFPLDPRPLSADEINVPSPLGGDVKFSFPMSHRRIGMGWATWSHGYTGDVYYSNGASGVMLDVPSNSVFYLYAEPNPFGLFEFEITGMKGAAIASVKEMIEGLSGARGYAFCGGVQNIEVRTTDGVTDFAIGEFGIAN